MCISALWHVTINLSNRKGMIDYMSTVIRVEKTREYVVMNNKFLRNKQMSLKAKGLLALCLSLPDDWDYSINGLVSITKESITAVRNAMKELEELGYMKINKLQNEKGQFRYEYVIYETPHIENLHVDNADMENLHVEKQDVDNQLQQSIENKVSNKKVFNKDLYIKEHASAAIWSPLNDYLEMRKEIGAELTERGLKLLLKRLDKLSNNNINIQRLMLENAIQSQWKNVYLPKDQEIEAAGKALKNELKSFYGI
jgi:predicted transcriptional regulator